MKKDIRTAIGIVLGELNRRLPATNKGTQGDFFADKEVYDAIKVLESALVGSSK